MNFDALATMQAESFRRAGKTMLGSFLPAQALNAEELQEFLTRKTYSVLATTRPDGRPLASMILFLVWRDAFWLPSARGAVRLNNLRSQPWASLVVFEGEENEHTVVVVEGSTSIHESVSPIFDQGLGRVWQERVPQPRDWVAALIELKPSRLLSFRAAKAAS